MKIAPFCGLILALLALQWAQKGLPLNPEGLDNLSWHLALNTAISSQPSAADNCPPPSCTAKASTSALPASACSTRRAHRKTRCAARAS